MKDPKEYASDLVEKYMPLVTNWDCYHDIPLPRKEVVLDAKECALIAVDEKIETCNKFYTQLSFPAEVKSDSGYIQHKKELDYLNQVKQEIIKIK